jgi:3-hydroxyacyl-CoA dehydrogenase
MTIRRAAVIGSGVMGGGIAAHLANAGVEVLLLDVAAEGEDQSAIARAAIERLKNTDPAPFMHRSAARLVQPGNIEDDLDRIGEADWIIEAIVEKLEVKQALYRRLEAVRRPGSIVSSNTSTLPLARLSEGMGETFRRDFLITHFFNPPRYLRLLEVVAGPATRAEAVAAISAFADRELGKAVVRCKDTPGFIANRIGSFWMQAAMTDALEARIDVEEADALISRPFGIPKTGVFGLADLVGIDLLPHVAASLRAALPADDPFHAEDRQMPLIERLIENGFTGRKGRGGFYRLSSNGGGRQKEVIDLRTGEYRPATRPRLDVVGAARKNPRAVFESDHPAARWAAGVMTRTLAYAASRVPEIADDITAIDAAMRTGYAFERGPFEILDRLGPAWFRDQLAKRGMPVPPLLEKVGDRTFYEVRDGRLHAFGSDGSWHPVARPEGVLLLEDVKRASQPVIRNGSASLWDIGDGVACLEFHTKMNAIDLDTLALIEKAITTVSKDFKALVFYTEAPNFSVGANIGLALFAANAAAFPMVEEMVGRGQRTFRKLKYAPFPVVAAPAGMTLGGGCEICLNAAAVQAHAETYIGLPEVGVGIIPGWTGSTELLSRWMIHPKRPGGPMPAITKVFETIGMAHVAKSAFEAKDALFFRPGDGITMNRDRLLADAKTKALELARNYLPPEKVEIRLPGPSARLALTMAVDALRLSGKATPHDEVVAGELATVLSGGATDITLVTGEDDLLKLEREAFMRLVRTPATLARMEHMLDTGKPLRN